MPGIFPFWKYVDYKNEIESPFVFRPVRSFILMDNPDYCWKLALLNFRNKNYEAAIELLKRFSCYVRNDRSERLFANVYKEVGQYELAEKHLKSGIAMYPSKYTCRYDLMLLYEQLGRYEDSVSIAKGIVEMPEKISTGFAFFVIEEAKKRVAKYNRGEYKE